MIYLILQILLWLTAILLFIAGLDDLYMDLLYWLQRRKYKNMMPDFSEMFQKEEKPIAIFLGAWKEASVIGRTLSYAVRNLNYTNYRFFVGAYPNDADTIRVVQEISKKDPRVIACINPLNGPTTKADNLNSLYAGLLEYENLYGLFDMIIVHDAEDFIHPNAMKLYNYLLGYKGFHAVQIPVVPIKSRLGKLYHRTYCDAFAEVHTKDMIVRQAMGTFIPFSGTGMGFHRKTFNYLEKYNWEVEAAQKGIPIDEFGEKVNENLKLSAEDFSFDNDEDKKPDIYINDTNYHDDPFQSLNDDQVAWGQRHVPDGIRHFTFLFIAGFLAWVSFLIYTGKTEATQIEGQQKAHLEKFYLSPSDLNAKEKENQLMGLFDKSNSSEILPQGVMKTENGYLDSKNNVMYIKTEDNKFTIQESTWKTEQGALKRFLDLKKSGLFNGKNIKLDAAEVAGESYFRIYISDYSSLQEANQSITNFILKDL